MGFPKILNRVLSYRQWKTNFLAKTNPDQTANKCPLYCVIDVGDIELMINSTNIHFIWKIFMSCQLVWIYALNTCNSDRITILSGTEIQWNFSTCSFTTNLKTDEKTWNLKPIISCWSKYEWRKLNSATSP